MQDTKFIEDIMSQNYNIGTYYNATRFFIIFAIIKDNILRNKILISELAEYVFDAYCANPVPASRNSNLDIQKIPKFGIDAIYDDISDALMDWQQDAPNGLLTFDSKQVFLECNSAELIDKLNRILPLLFRKTFGIDFNFPQNPNNMVDCSTDDIDIFGNGIFKAKALKEYQHCILCDNSEFDELRVVRILKKKDGLLQSESSNLDNMLIMCKEHAIEYMEGKFNFNESGRVENIASKSLSNQMRIDIKYKSKERMDFVKRKLSAISKI